MMDCIGVRVSSGFCPRMNSMLKALVIGVRSRGWSELIVSMTRGLMIRGVFMMSGVD